MALGASATGAAQTLAGAPTVDVWIDLSEPVVVDAVSAEEARRRTERIGAQQRRVAQALRALGAEELARLRHVRNAIAVRIAASRTAELRAIPGVVRVRPARGLHEPRPLPTPP